VSTSESRWPQAEAARSVAEENTRRSNFLSHAGRLLTASLDPEIAARQLMEMLVPEFGGRASVTLCDEAGDPSVVFDCDVSPRACGGWAGGPRQKLSGVRDRVVASNLAGKSAPMAGDSDTLHLPLVTAGRAVGALVLWSRGADPEIVPELAERSPSRSRTRVCIAPCRSRSKSGATSRRACRRRTGARTSSWRCCRTSCAIRSRRSALRSR
jgi:hypothetical protein